MLSVSFSALILKAGPLADKGSGLYESQRFSFGRLIATCSNCSKLGQSKKTESNSNSVSARVVYMCYFDNEYSHESICVL